jgi:hypothetical protein
MGFMDKMKEQATQLAEKTQQAVGQGQAKIGDTLAKRKADSYLLELGGLTYQQSTGASGAQHASRITSLLAQLQAHEQQHGPIVVSNSDEAADAGAAGVPLSGNYVGNTGVSQVPVAQVAQAGPIPQSTPIPTGNVAPIPESSMPVAEVPGVQGSTIPIASTIPTAQVDPSI